ncbi:hypothetical protein RA280_43735 [Cupriavidus sp. CV2]|uniref:hypothetical protein n=1 Tax=Cupriavidus ulmosensis TaxID=3065913 RepID=UPI00296B5243|nr:hypothetical protein [Cupriavidus sp. CV2]MDW3688521.1 hypothetical protein [Cupriavidus sp. CV2]
MDTSYDSDAAPTATSSGAYGMSAYHPEVLRMCAGPWSDAIATLAHYQEAQTFRQHLELAFVYCSDLARTAQRRRQLAPVFVSWPFHRVLEQSRLWAKMCADLAGTHGADWKEKPLSYAPMVAQPLQVQGVEVVPIKSPVALLEASTSVSQALTIYAADCTSGVKSVFVVTSIGNWEPTSVFVMERQSIDGCAHLLEHIGAGGQEPPARDISVFAHWVKANRNRLLSQEMLALLEQRGGPSSRTITVAI